MQEGDRRNKVDKGRGDTDCRAGGGQGGGAGFGKKKLTQNFNKIYR